MNSHSPNTAPGKPSNELTSTPGIHVASTSAHVKNFAAQILLSKLTPDNVWKLVVDGRLHANENGPNGYESREANSIEGVLKGLAFTLQDIDNELTAEHICKVHQLCMQGVKSANPCEPGVYRTNEILSVQFGASVTKEGAIEFLHSASARNPQLYLATTGSLPNSPSVSLSSLPIEVRFSGNVRYEFNQKLTLKDLENDSFEHELRQGTLRLTFAHHRVKIKDIPVTVKEIVSTFNQQIKEAKNENDKLHCIAVLAQDLIRQVHPFRDGNNRVIVNCIVQRLLIKHVGKMALFFDPNSFELHSLSQLVKILQNAISLANDVLLNPIVTVFGYHNKNIAKKFIDLGKSFLDALIEKKQSYYQNSRPYFNDLTKIMSRFPHFWSATNIDYSENELDALHQAVKEKMTIFSLGAERIK